ncbi:MAG: hypothetical protein A2350_00080 [Candidatus Raymondbacteria bacterium RifOxyB12_full_50_8]|nr:MAG: hypothetical protein A2350_00080 [Candidatus Raymondbacteria bacterium RifOxyB12_full_50_8]
MKICAAILLSALLCCGFSIPDPAADTLVGALGPVKFYREKKPVVGLVLCGGGARGFAHIGVIKALEREGIYPDVVVGTSMGSAIGGFYATGITGEELEQMALSVNWKKIFAAEAERRDKFFTQKKGEEDYILEFRFTGGEIMLPTALTSGQQLISLFLEKTIGFDYASGFNFDNLPRKFRAVATDLVSAKMVVLGKGCLAEAMRASLAVPFVFTPFTLNNRQLVDGGFMNILPIDVAKSMGAEVIIAVDVKPVLYTEEELTNPISFIDQIVAICLISQENRPVRDSAIVINPELGRHGSADFDDITRLISEGELIAMQRMTDIRKEIARLSAVKTADTGAITIQSIKINNLKLTAFNDIFPLLNLEPEQTVSKERVRQAARSLYNSGWFDSVWVVVDTLASSECALEFSIREHESIRKIEFVGNTVFPDSALEALFPLKAGMPLNRVRAEEGCKAITSAYAEKGYALGGVREMRAEAGTLRIIIGEGRIQSIAVEGNTRTNESIITREMSMLAGKRFSIADALRDIRALYATGLFSHVYITLDEKADDIALNVKVEERPFQVFQAGARYDNVRMLEGFLRFKALNFAHRGYALTGRLQYGLRREKYLLSLKTDRIFQTFLAAESKVYYYRDRKFTVDVNDSTLYSFNMLRKLGTMFTLAHQIGRMGKLSYLFYLEHYKSNQEEIDFGPINSYGKGLRVFSIRTEFDTYDKVDFPSRGFDVFSSIDLGLDIIGQHQAFFNFTLTAANVLPLSENNALLPALFMSLSDVALPDPVKNYMGGSTELKMNDNLAFNNSFPLYGYAEQAFTGDILMIGRLAYRLRLPRSSYLFLVANAGKTWPKADKRLCRTQRR